MKILDNSAELQQLCQIGRGTVWDGDLISKSATEWLFDHNLIHRAYGYSTISVMGIQYLVDLKLIRP